MTNAVWCPGWFLGQTKAVKERLQNSEQSTALLNNTMFTVIY